MKRSKAFILIALIFLSKGLLAQTENKAVTDGIYYIVRHAEKDTGKNPVLVTAGYARCGDLYRALKDKKISKIYVNQYKRIQLTADSLRIYNKIDTVHYVVDVTGDGLMNTLSETLQPSDKNVLIIGHSNTVPVIIRRLGVTDYDVKELGDHEYDNLFVVTIKDHKATLQQLKYGKRSVAKDPSATMKSLQ